MGAPLAHWYLCYSYRMDDKDDDSLVDSQFPFIALERRVLSSALERIKKEISTLKVFSAENNEIYLLLGGNIILNTDFLPKSDFNAFVTYAVNGFVPDVKIRLIHPESKGIESLANAARLPYDPKKVVSVTSKNKFRYLP